MAHEPTQNGSTTRETLSLDEAAAGFRQPPTVTDLETAEDRLARDIEMMDPEEARQAVTQASAQAFKQFEIRLVALIDALGQTLESKREEFDFAATYKRADRMAKGKIEKNDPDRRLRLSFGRSKRAVNTATAAARHYLLDSGPSPVEIAAKGDNDENTHKEQAIEQYLADQRERAGFSDVLGQFLWDRNAYQLGVIRHRYAGSRRLELNPETGQIEETETPAGMLLENWPLSRVWFGDYHQPTEDSQTIVAWHSERALHEIESEELRIEHQVAAEADPETGAVRIVASESRSGRFVNLEVLRDERKSRGRPLGSTNEGDSLAWIRNLRGEDDRASNAVLPILGLIEWEGYLPGIGQIVEEGSFDPILLDFFALGIERGLSRRDLGRLMEGVFWNATVTTSGRLIEFRPCPYSPARNTAVTAPYKPGSGLLGQGIPQLAGDLEHAMDRLMNDTLETSLYNSNPNATAALDVLKDSNGAKLTEDEISDLTNGHGKTFFFDATLAERPVEYHFRPVNPNALAEMQFYGEEIDEQTFITPAIAGQSTGGTATEVSLNQGRSELRVTDTDQLTGRRVVEKIHRQHLLDVERFMSAEALNEELVRITGRGGIGGHYIFPTLEGLADQFKITHAGVPMLNRERRAANVERLAAGFISIGEMDPKTAMNELLKLLLQERNPERWRAQKTRTMEPAEELRLLAKGHWVEPTAGEDAEAHFEAHLADYGALSVEPTGEDARQVPAALENFDFDLDDLMPALEEHLKRTAKEIERRRREAFASAAGLAGPEIPGEAGGAALAQAGLRAMGGGQGTITNGAGVAGVG